MFFAVVLFWWFCNADSTSWGICVVALFDLGLRVVTLWFDLCCCLMWCWCVLSDFGLLFSFVILCYLDVGGGLLTLPVCVCCNFLVDLLSCIGCSIGFLPLILLVCELVCLF